MSDTSVQPVPMILHCPVCHARHLDEGEFATRVHHTHACQACGHCWRPAVVPTVGVQFLPGFKTAVPREDTIEQRMRVALRAGPPCDLNSYLGKQTVLAFVRAEVRRAREEMRERAATECEDVVREYAEGTLKTTLWTGHEAARRIRDLAVEEGKT